MGIFPGNLEVVKVMSVYRKASKPEFSKKDFKKAFDTMDHKILLHKLCHYWIRDLANSWFSSCLPNRKQFVTINEFN